MNGRTIMHNKTKIFNIAGEWTYSEEEGKYIKVLDKQLTHWFNNLSLSEQVNLYNNYYREQEKEEANSRCCK